MSVLVSLSVVLVHCMALKVRTVNTHNVACFLQSLGFLSSVGMATVMLKDAFYKARFFLHGTVVHFSFSSLGLSLSLRSFLWTVFQLSAFNTAPGEYLHFFVYV